MAATDIVAPAHFTLNTMWQSIEVKVNNTIINPASTHNIPFKAVMESHLSVGESNTNWLAASMFHPDQRGKAGEATDDNKGFKSRREAAVGGFDMSGPIPVDFLHVDNHLAPGNTLSLKFTQALDSFVLNTATDEKYRLLGFRVEDLVKHPLKLISLVIS